MIEPVKPSRTFEARLEIGADSLDALTCRLRNILIELERGGELPMPYNSVSGGYDSGSVVQIIHNPQIDHDSYFEAVDVYLGRTGETRAA